MKNIKINGKIININVSQDEDDYISLTDMAQFKGGNAIAMVISHWLSNRNTINYIGIWEKLHNPNFKVTEFRYFEMKAGINGFTVSPSQLIKTTGVIGLKSEDQKRLSLDWSAKRMLSKINYRIQIDSIHKNIVIPNELTKHQAKFTYATEADLLNVALFGITAKEWSVRNPDKPENIRDYADAYQLVCLSNLESINAFLIENKISQQDRIIQLNKTAIVQMSVLVENGKVVQIE